MKLLKKPIIGIDVGGTRIKIGVIQEGKVFALRIIEADSSKELRILLPRIQSEVKSIIHQLDIKPIGIGMSFPGIVDCQHNKVLDTSSKYSDAPEIDLVKWSAQSFDLTLRLDNDARLACLGEWKYGIEGSVKNLVTLTLGTGIGTSAIVDGTILRGRHFTAGILGGHFIINYTNKIDECSCGRYGCGEGIGSIWMLESKARRDPLFSESLLSQIRNKLDWETLLLVSSHGDPLAQKLKDHCLKIWSIILVNLIHAYDPEVVVVGGGIAHSSEIIIPYFKKRVDESAWYTSKPPKIVRSKFPDSAVLLGAATLFT